MKNIGVQNVISGKTAKQMESDCLFFELKIWKEEEVLWKVFLLVCGNTNINCVEIFKKNSLGF